MLKFGLIGKKLTHSFSKEYFTTKFIKNNISAVYNLYELPDISNFTNLKNTTNLKGLNVTIPYKEQIILFLDELDPIAKEIGAVNTIVFENGKTKGFNSDYYGFKESLAKFINNTNIKALVLGTGGASKAIQKVLTDLNIDFILVSRTNNENQISYDDLSDEIIKNHQLVINTTPLGMFPNVDNSPLIPYEVISENHFCFDLVYNPERSQFIEKCESKGAKTKNGLEMLHLQAEKSWSFWNC